MTDIPSALVPQMVSPVVTFAIFTASSVAKNSVLDFSRMFTSLAFLILLTQPLFSLFAGIIDFVAAIGCFDRINDYLAAESRHDNRELLSDIKPRDEKPADDEYENAAIALRQVTATWSREDHANSTPSGITLAIPSSKLTLVIGPVASGKSTLLKTILGELPVSSGQVLVSSKEIAFCDQTPWLFNGTILENITAFSSLDPVYYERVLHACALESDLQELQDRDRTKVGSKGFALSSGQKQRIALARAVYSRKSIMLFDDILSQLDVPTQRHIFTHLLGPDGLLRGSNITVVLATHAVSFLPFADRVIVMSECAIKEQGTCHELRARQGGYVYELHRKHTIDEHRNLPGTSEPVPTNRVAPLREVAKESHNSSPSSKPEDADTANDKKRLLGDTGIYVYYFSCLGWLLTFTFFLLQVAFAFFTVFPNIWLKWWAESNGENPNAENARYASGFASLQIAGLVSSGVLTWFSFNIIAQKAGLQLHIKILDAIMRAPMSLFSTTDTGSITTKFSQDFQLVDSKLPLSLMCVVTNLFITIGQAGLIASASAWIVLSFPVLIAVFYVVQRYYLRTSRQMRLLDLEQKAPL